MHRALNANPRSSGYCSKKATDHFRWGSEILKTIVSSSVGGSVWFRVEETV